jgi:hypothetical protein
MKILGTLLLVFFFSFNVSFAFFEQQLEHNSNSAFGHNNNTSFQTGFAYNFTFPFTLSSVTTQICRLGSPTDTVELIIYKLDRSVIATSSNAITGSTLDLCSTYSNYEFLFDDIFLQTGFYIFQLSRTGSLSTTHRYQFAQNNSVNALVDQNVFNTYHFYGFAYRDDTSRWINANQPYYVKIDGQYTFTIGSSASSSTSTTEIDMTETNELIQHGLEMIDFIFLVITFFVTLLLGYIVSSSFFRSTLFYKKGSKINPHDN